MRYIVAIIILNKVLSIRLIKNKKNDMSVYFWVLGFVPLAYMTVFLPI